MARPVIFGNGSLTVGLNEHGLVHDFYYPYVGLENLTTSRSAHHMIGVWVDGNFSWVDDGSWETKVDFENDALIGNISIRNNELGLELGLVDFVDSEYEAFCRQVTVQNLTKETREVRLFMHQVFQISRAGRADTALFVPGDNYILDYKGQCSLLIYGQEASSGKVFDQFAIGSYGIEGKEGTFRDAEDGELSGSAVEHGGVDSVIRFSATLAAEASTNIDYWIAASDTQLSVEKIHNKLKSEGLDARYTKTRNYWNTWLNQSAERRESVPAEYRNAVSKSLLIIKSHIDKRGGIIASCDSSIYNYGRDYYSYVWPRDGAFVMWPLIRLGYAEEPKKFFEFCRDILTPEGYLMHKYQPDKAIGSTWHPLLHGKRKELAIQEDETAIVLYMLGEYYEYIRDEAFVESMYGAFIKPAADFLGSFMDEQTGLPHASYDLWEEKFLTNTYTVAVVYQALLTAGDFAEKFGHSDDANNWRNVAQSILKNSQVLFDPLQEIYRKGYLLQENKSLEYDNTLDVSSFYGVMMFGLYENPEQLHKTLRAIEETLLDQSPSGGSPRYEHDRYFASTPAQQGNPWFVTTLWIAQYYARAKQLDKVKKYVDWSLQHALPSGVLSEQVEPTTGKIISVTPLVWSHAELVNTVLDISKD